MTACTVLKAWYNVRMKIVVIDGQGGKIGRIIVEQILSEALPCELFVVGTNAVATEQMLKGGATNAATGENPVVVLSRDADFIIGPIGIVLADSMLGEITPVIAHAVSASHAHKILIPINKCVTISGVQDLPMKEYIKLAVDKLKESL